VKGNDSTAPKATDAGRLDSESALAKELAVTFDIPLGLALQVASGQLPLEEAQQRASRHSAAGSEAAGSDPSATKEEIRRVLAGEVPPDVDLPVEAALSMPPAEPPDTPKLQTRSRAEELAELSANHGLPKHLAEMVLDGRLTVEAALAQTEAVGRRVDEAVDLPLSPEPAPSGVTVRTTGSRRGPNYDPGFRPAVAKGYLTVQQAVQRGNRDALARRLQQRHGLSQREALRVADNRISIHEMLQQRESRPAPATRRGRAAPARKSKKKRKRRTGLMVAWLLLILAATSAAALVGWNRWQKQVARTRAQARPAPVAATQPEAAPESAAAETPAVSSVTPATPPGSEVLTDEDGRVTRVTGPDPRAVLDAYCASVAGLDPIGLEEGAGISGFRIGLLNDLSQPGKRFSIRIRRDNRSGRWLVGDGSAPVDPYPAS
jgi:hypothetical protein